MHCNTKQNKQLLGRLLVCGTMPLSLHVHGQKTVCSCTSAPILSGVASHLYNFTPLTYRGHTLREMNTINNTQLTDI